MRRVLIVFITFGLLINCNKNVTESSAENPLLGRWTESFSWINIFDCITIGWITNCPEVSESSTIEFTESTFELWILPPSQTYMVEDDTLHVGLSGDTVYSGSYEYDNDTIIFYIDDVNNPIKMRYWFQNDSLSVTAVSGNQMVIMDGDTSYISTFPMASFMWGSAWGKTHGIFGKIE